MRPTEALTVCTEPVEYPQGTLRIYDVGDKPHLDPLYEHGLLQLVERHPWPADLVSYVCGAHQGLWSTFLASILPQGRVFSFEPHPDNFVCLANNVAGLGLGNVALIPCALGDRDGTAPLHVWDGHRSTSPKIEFDADPAGEGIRLVPMRKIDSLLLPPPGFIKMDVEYLEREVLRGAEKTLRAYRPCLLVDLHRPPDNDLQNYLRGLGYSVVQEKQAIPKVNHYGEALWCVPEGRK